MRICGISNVQLITVVELEEKLNVVSILIVALKVE